MFASMLQSFLPEGTNLEQIIADGQAAIKKIVSKAEALEVAQETIATLQGRIYAQNQLIISLLQKETPDVNSDDHGNCTEQPES